MESQIKKKVYSEKKPADGQNLKAESVKKLDAVGLANAIAKLIESHHKEQSKKHEDLEKGEDVLAKKAEKKLGKKLDVETEEGEEKDSEGY